MRIDKWLKVSRIIKRRTVAKTLLDRELFEANGKIVKPSYQIKEGDILTLVLGRHKLKVEILKCEKSSRKEDSAEMYKILEDTIIKDDQD